MDITRIRVGGRISSIGKLVEISCLITDVRMAGIDGLELQRRVKLDRPQLPVIFISGHHDDEVERKAIEEGAVGFLYKPFDPGELLTIMNQAMSNGSQVRTVEVQGKKKS